MGMDRVPGYRIQFEYVNHRDEAATRTVTPIKVLFVSSGSYGYENEWVLEAYDHDREALRTFAMRKIENWRPASVAEEG
jgi:predicted DNA-binding transcriptional regulator YafY